MGFKSVINLRLASEQGAMVEEEGVAVRAAALWMIKRVKADGWSEARALEEANALGLNDRFRPFALNYLRTHP